MYQMLLDYVYSDVSRGDFSKNDKSRSLVFHILVNFNAQTSLTREMHSVLACFTKKIFMGTIIVFIKKS